MQFSHQEGFALTAAVLVAYPTLVSLLRFRRTRNLATRYNYPTRESMARMTDDDAWEIQKELAELEFPFIYTKSLQFALFRVRGCTVLWGYVYVFDHLLTESEVRLMESPQFRIYSRQPASSPDQRTLSSATAILARWFRSLLATRHPRLVHTPPLHVLVGCTVGTVRRVRFSTTTCSTR